MESYDDVAQIKSHRLTSCLLKKQDLRSTDGYLSE